MKEKVLPMVLSFLMVLFVATFFAQPALAYSEYDEYKTVWGTPQYKTAGGYAGNQPSGGVRFSTGGGFYFSDSGGPTASLSYTFPPPYSNFSFSVSLGNRSTSVTGYYVNAPNTTDYFKLYVEKEYKVTPYVTYIKRYYGIEEPGYPGYYWDEYSKGHTKTLYRMDPYARKVY